jgi:hypothetical protein
MIIKDGSTTPIVEKVDPSTPLTLYPIYVAELMAIGPGVDSAIATISRNSSFVIQPFFSTSSLSISASIA